MSEAPTLSPLVWDGERAPLAKALVAAQKATESIKKAASNPHFKSKYADLSEVVEGVVPALNGAGVAVLQPASADADAVSVTTVFLHESGSSVSSTLTMRASKSDPQGIGSAITYARRYALLAMSGAAPEDDDGNAASGPRQDRSEPRRTEPKPPTLSERADRLEASLKEARPDQVEKAWQLAASLRADLFANEPDRLEALVSLYNTRRPADTEERAAA
jgi:hypothetical protein